MRRFRLEMGIAFLKDTGHYLISNTALNTNQYNTNK